MCSIHPVNELLFYSYRLSAISFQRISIPFLSPKDLIWSFPGTPIPIFPAHPFRIGEAKILFSSTFTVEITGANEKSNPKRYMFGLDYLLIVPVKETS